MDGHKADKTVSYRKIEKSKSQSSQIHNNVKQTYSKASVNLIAPMHKNMVQISINGRKTNALCDTGASISCCNKAFLQKMLRSESGIKPTNIQTVVGVGGEQHSVSGKVDLDISFNGLTVSFAFHVIENLLHSLILGIDFMESTESIVVPHIKATT